MKSKIYREPTFLVGVTCDSMGFYTAEPVRADILEAYATYMEGWTDVPDGTAFFQGDYELPGWIAENKRAMGLLNRGWPATVRVTPYEYGMSLGWDASELEVKL